MYQTTEIFTTFEMEMRCKECTTYTLDETCTYYSMVGYYYYYSLYDNRYYLLLYNNRYYLLYTTTSSKRAGKILKFYSLAKLALTFKSVGRFQDPFFLGWI